MANAYFQFKQFTIFQDQCAMKVTTDSCLFGAWYAKKWANAGGIIMDLGSGTGLLLLMLLQKTQAMLHGVEINDSCFEQLTSNIGSSPWPHRTRLFHADARVRIYDESYDFIICNPPFHQNQLKSMDGGKDTAHHSLMFTLDDLLKVSDRILKPEGKLAVLLPFYRVNEFIGEAVANGFYPEELVCVRQSPEHDYFRGMLLLKRDNTIKADRHSLCITDQNRKYTSEFTDLMKDYYLNL